MPLWAHNENQAVTNGTACFFCLSSTTLLVVDAKHTLKVLSPAPFGT